MERVIVLSDDGNLDQIVGYIPGDMDTSDGPTKAMSSANMRNLLTRNTFRIATEEKENQIRKLIPASKRYIVYHE